MVGLRLLCWTPLLAIFQLYRGVQFYWWRKITDLLQVTDHHSMTRRYKKTTEDSKLIFSFTWEVSICFLQVSGICPEHLRFLCSLTILLPLLLTCLQNKHKNYQIIVILRFVKTFLSSKIVLCCSVAESSYMSSFKKRCISLFSRFSQIIFDKRVFFCNPNDQI